MLTEIPWPARPADLPTDEHGQRLVGRFTVWKRLRFGDELEEEWFYGDEATGFVCGPFSSEYDAVNEGALRDDYRNPLTRRGTR